MFKNFLILLSINLFSATAFSQSQLEKYIQQGLQNSPLLKDYQNQLLSNSIDSAVIFAQRKPQVNAIGQVMLAPTVDGWGYDEAVTNKGNYAAQLSASQNIFTKKIVAPQYLAVKIENQIISNTSKISAHDLKKSITDQYLSAYTSLQQLTINQSIYKLLKEEEIFLQKFVQQGIYRQTDYLTFEITIQSQEIQIRQLQNQYRADLRQLNFLCGINDTSYQVLSAPEIQPQLASQKYNSPLLTQFRIDSMKISNQRTLIDINYRPRLGWFADAGFLSSNPALLYKNFGASFGLNFTVPIYDGRQKKLQYQKLSINESTRTGYQTYFKNQYDLRIQQINLEIADNEQLLNQIKNQLQTTETLIKVSKELLNKGELSVNEFILTIRNYIDIKSMINQTEFKKLQLANELNYWNW